MSVIDRDKIKYKKIISTDEALKDVEPFFNTNELEIIKKEDIKIEIDSK